MALTGGPTSTFASVIGNKRMLELVGCTIANGDTYSSGLKYISNVDVQPSAGGAHVLGITSVSSGVVTFATAGGSETGCYVMLIGW